MHETPPCELSWGWYLELSAAREPGRRLRWSEVLAWAQTTGRWPLRWIEAQLIAAYDLGYMDYIDGQDKK